MAGLLGVDIEDFDQEDEDVQLAVSYLESIDISAETVDLLTVRDARMNYRPGVRLEVVPVTSLAYKSDRSAPTYRLRVDVNSKTGAVALFSIDEYYEDCRLLQFQPVAHRSSTSSRLIQDSMGDEGAGDIIITFEEEEPEMAFLLVTSHIDDSDAVAEHLADMLGHTLDADVDGIYPGDMSVTDIADIVRVLMDSGMKVDIAAFGPLEWEDLLEFWEDNSHIVS